MTDDPFYFRQIPLGPMENFVYLVGDRNSRQCLVVDPAWDTTKILEVAEADDMKITGSLVTHYHPDHVGGNALGFAVPGGVAEVVAQCDAPAHVNKHEAEGLKMITGLSESDLVRHEGGDRIKVGEVEIQLIHTPGHTPGSQCFLVGDRLISGDTLFVQGCGRVDLPGSDPAAMYETLTGTLAELSDDVVLFPGHDYGPTPTSTLAEERKHNHSLRIRSLDDWLRLMAPSSPTL